MFDKVKVIFQFLILCFVVSILSACSEDAEEAAKEAAADASNLAASIHSLDLSGAEAFMVTGAVSSTGVASLNYKSEAYTAAVGDVVDMDPNSLYKVTADGSLVRVGVLDESGAELPRGTVKPYALKEINNNYLIVWFWIEGYAPYADDPTLQQAGFPNQGDILPYLVHRPTGLAYSGEGVFATWLDYGNTLDEPPTVNTIGIKLKTDDHDNIYLMDEYGASVVKIRNGPRISDSPISVFRPD